MHNLESQVTLVMQTVSISSTHSWHGETCHKCNEMVWLMWREIWHIKSINQHFGDASYSKAIEMAAQKITEKVSWGTSWLRE